MDRTIKLWDLQSGKLLNTYEGHTDYLYSVAISPDNLKVASGSGDYTIKLWDLESGKLLKTYGGHRDEVRSVAISPDNLKVASCSTLLINKVCSL